MIAIRRGKPVEAAGIYEAILAEDAQDFESWGNLGVCRLSSGNAKGAIEALTNSLACAATSNASARNGPRPKSLRAKARTG